MIRGFYTSAAGMIAQQRRQEMLTNNLANANTPGFKADDASLRSFPNMLVKAMGGDNRPLGNSHHVGELSTGVYLQEKTLNFRQGDIHETNNSTDIALFQGVVPVNEETGRPGALFFTVENNNGDTRYTRNGSFTVDGQGFLTTGEGFYVLDNNGDRIQVANEDFRVSREGIIFNDVGEITQLNVAFVENPNLLVKEGNGLLRYEGEEPVGTAVGNGAITYQLQQGFIERSNVDATQTMTDMMTAFRAFEANQRVLQAYDRSMEKAANEIGRIG
ncbi:flagellar biosynthesis protein FlgC [Anaerobacillus alkalilacustris]|uniref:Flagellar biosynthesis protein FlgC n=1 Tax=Anaerobacillus alkalilacustris TaxID=393763 RepID=A0A1S2LHL9_9BACI|nr:flagellar hook-basal body protein [Anaerobacillus alkalilacustris]OIJ11720.1 flagellar biosynthesis protein FlgC [Anaerobacillus alkalilacustris]